MIGADYWHARVGRPVDYRTAENAGNAYMVGGVHAVDAARFITGLDVVAVCSASTQIGSAAAEGYQMDTADALLVKYSNGAIGRVSAAIHGHMPYQLNLDILGDDGILQNNRLFTRDNAEGDPFTILEEDGPNSGNVDHHAFPFLMAHFLDCIATGKETAVSLKNSVNTHEVGFAADISKRLGGGLRFRCLTSASTSEASLMDSQYDVVRLENVTKNYGSITALERCHIGIPRGESRKRRSGREY